MEGGPWRDQRGEKETSWEVGPETQMVVSWSKAVIREMVRSAWMQTMFQEKSSQDLLTDYCRM